MHSAAPAPSPEQFGTNSYPANAATSATALSYPESHSVRQTAPTTLSDLAREVAIQQLGRDIETHMAEVAAINNRDPHQFSDFADAAMARGRADLARRDMERLIRGRSAEQLARMQAAQNERMAREPGATS